MDSGELITRGSVWIALSCYAVSELLSAMRPERERAAISWWFNVAGCIFFLGHIASAFHYFYHWSHAAAYAETARQSKQMTGWNSGVGLYINYIFALVWVSKVIRTRTTRVVSWAGRKIWSWMARVFFLFMIFNGAFVFVRNEYRWLGLALCLLVLLSWGLRIKRSVDWGAVPKSS